MKLGKTRSGKEIEYKPLQSLHNFITLARSLSLSDRFDLLCMLHFLYARAKRKNGIPLSEIEWWRTRPYSIWDSFTEKEINKEKAKLKLVTSIDFHNFGKNLIHPLFWDD